MSRRSPFNFRLYVAGGALNSALAVTNLATLCRDRLRNQCKVEIVDVFREPQRALADHVFMTPTLVKLGPPPGRRIVGTLSQAEPVLQALGLDAVPA